MVKYENAEMEVILFDAEDVITESNGGLDEGELEERD